MMKKMAIVVPCYNEENRLPVEKFTSFAKDKESDLDIYFVNDGSKDNTLPLITQLSEENPNIYALDFGKNQGKAEAVRQAFLEIADGDRDYEYYGFLDADLATPLSEMTFIYDSVKHSKNEVVLAMGSRFARLGSSIKRLWYRHYLGRVFATLTSIMLDLQVYDTQCGAKLMKSDVVKEIMTGEFVTRWFFDVEIIYRISNKFGVENSKNIILEVPLNQWEEMGDSRLKGGDFLTAPLELLKIYRKYS